jgi:predicted phosphodiesterase
VRTAFLLITLLLTACATPRPAEPFVVGGKDGLTLSWEGEEFDYEVLVDGERALPALEDGVSRVRVPGCSRDVRFLWQGDLVKVRSLPCPTADVVRFTFLTDTQANPELAGQFAKRALARGSSFFVHGGDIVQNGGVRAQWRALFAAMGHASAQIPLVAAVGNHEYWFDPRGDEVARFLDKPALEDTWYTFSSGPLDVVVLNSAVIESREKNWAQLKWLHAELDRLERERPDRWRIVAFHHPPYSQNFAQSSWYPRKEWEVVRKYYVPLFDEHHVDLVLNGHSHLFERATHGETQYLVGGAAGGILGLKGASDEHSKLAVRERTVSHVEVTPARLRVITEKLTGEVVDEIVLDRPMMASQTER